MARQKRCGSAPMGLGVTVQSRAVDDVHPESLAVHKYRIKGIQKPGRRADQVMFPVHNSTVSGDHDTDGAGARRIVVRRFEVYRREGAHQRLASLWASVLALHERAEEHPPIVIVFEDRLAPIPARGHVIQGPREFDAKRSRHGRGA